MITSSTDFRETCVLKSEITECNLLTVAFRESVASRAKVGSYPGSRLPTYQAPAAAIACIAWIVASYPGSHLPSFPSCDSLHNLHSFLGVIAGRFIPMT